MMKSLSSNISIEGITENGFVLPNGYSWDVKVENGMKEGEVTVRNKMRLVYAVLQYNHDKLNGLCCFYDKGKLMKEITFVNNIAEGWSCEFEKGGVESWFIYKNGKKVSKLVKCEELEPLRIPGFRVLETRETGETHAILEDQNFENGNFLKQTYFHIRYH